ncbi:hypothetical protein [Chitinophaga sancti]|uniref:Uncharacterized protein n=1 Tax=Chitinophaga sancti TaxID=1004 RepID=A0A1K1RR12_9BACT|nr:hypothetical protein [Chitinophaga sancti]WQD62519.1 hypothetical protein U0033_32005 [Chitinophaga sancti]WQG91912.1 hypothetical protein SR876_10380 [Chitinophaga sancti]SFW74175.1 hypothetical protein SAMN05661012_04113 [Chitinophaga sancti]
MNWKSFAIYFVLSIIWSLLFINLAGQDARDLILLIMAGWFFYTLLWLCLTIVIRLTGYSSNRLVLLLPLLLSLIGYVIFDKHTFRFIAGLLAVCELALLYSFRPTVPKNQ